MKYSRPIKVGTILVFVSILCACASFDKSLKSYAMPPKVQQYFLEKYINQVDEVKCDLKQTPQGPMGRLSMRGRIELRNHISVSGDNDSRVRTIAKLFLKEEAGVLGLVDLSEWHDTGLIWTTDYYGDNLKKGIRVATINFNRYINNLHFLSEGYGPTIRMRITENDSITLFEASLAPASKEVYKAASKKTIAEEKAVSIVEKELKASKTKFSNIIMKKTLIDKPPYAIWCADISTNFTGMWLNYAINAFTGEVVFKKAVSGWD